MKVSRRKVLVSIQDNSKKGKDKDKAHVSGQMERSTQDNGKTTEKMERGIGKANKMILILVNGKTGKLMAMVFIINILDQNMKDNFVNFKNMEKGLNNFQMVISMKENIKMD